MKNQHPNKIIHILFSNGKVKQKEYDYREAVNCEKFVVYNESPSDYYLLERGNVGLLLKKSRLNDIQINDIINSVELFCKIEDYLYYIYPFKLEVEKIQKNKIKQLRKEIKEIQENHLSNTVSFINSIE